MCVVNFWGSECRNALMEAMKGGYRKAAASGDAAMGIGNPKGVMICFFRMI